MMDFLLGVAIGAVVGWFAYPRQEQLLSFLAEIQRLIKSKF